MNNSILDAYKWTYIDRIIIRDGTAYKLPKKLVVPEDMPDDLKEKEVLEYLVKKYLKKIG